MLAHGANDSEPAFQAPPRKDLQEHKIRAQFLRRLLETHLSLGLPAAHTSLLLPADMDAPPEMANTSEPCIRITLMLVSIRITTYILAPTPSVSPPLGEEDVSGTEKLSRLLQ